MRPIRLALVGLGKVARDQHIPALAVSPNFELVCGATIEGRCPAGATYPSIEAMLEAEPAIEAVALCQPPQARFEAARTALAAGKHVLLEKPPGTTVGELSVLADMARDRGLSLFAAWHSRFSAGVEPAKAWLQNRDILSVRVIWREDVRVWHPGQQWIWRPGGLGVFDPGINALSIATWILPPLRFVEGELAYPGNRQAPIAAELVMEVAGGGRLTADFDFRQTGPQIWDIHILTDGGSLLLGKGGERLSIDGKPQAVATAAEYPALYTRFAELIGRGESEVDSRPLQLTADAFLGSSRTTLEPFEYA